ncbi:CLEC-61.1 protein [Aphelenchoides avenae]|nr:CLEC-61.1 protein [Aphelenchus avenae]
MRSVQVATTVLSALYGVNIGQELVQQTRIGIVTFNADATIVAPLTKYTSFTDVTSGLTTLNATRVDQVNLLAGLKKADDVLKQVPVSRTRPVVFALIASAYKEGITDPTPFVNQIKAAGHKVMVIAAVRQDEGKDEVARILRLASDGFAFRTDTDTNMRNDLHTAFCQANCFCPNGWVQLADSYSKPKKLYAECVRLSFSAAAWFAASLSCPSQTQGRAFLASEFSSLKHQFHEDYVRNVRGIAEPYHIGLSYDEGAQTYVWKEKYANGTNKPLDNNGYQPWLGGSENHAKVGDAVQVSPSGFHTYWQNEDLWGTSSRYICQMNACDTDNYCDDSVDNN